MQKWVAITNDRNSDEIHIPDIPGGPSAFEIRAKFCYDMVVTLNAYSVVAARCFAEYLGMHEIIEKGNLIHIIGVFFNSSIFHIWKDSIIILQTTKIFLSLSENLKVISRRIDSTASKASIDVSRASKVPWARSFSRADVRRSKFDFDSKDLSYSMPFHECVAQRRANDL